MATLERIPHYITPVLQEANDYGQSTQRFLERHNSEENPADHRGSGFSYYTQEWSLYQTARLDGAHTIVTGISEAVTETIVDWGIDWRPIETMTDLQTGLRAVLTSRRGER